MSRHLDRRATREATSNTVGLTGIVEMFAKRSAERIARAWRER